MDGIDTVKDVINTQVSVASDYIKRCIVEKINMADGSIRVVLDAVSYTHLDVDKRQVFLQSPGILSGNCGGFKKEGKHLPLRGQYVLLFPRRGTKSSFFGRNLYGGFVLFPYLPDGQKFIG